MSTENISPSEAAGAQEFPDRVGFKPDNPYLANFRPYIPAGVHLRELTILPLIMGTILGMVFGAASLYLVLKVGLTVSASIPVAVLSFTSFPLSPRGGGLAPLLPPVLQGGRPRRHHPREQHRADGGLGRRVDCLRPRRHHAGDPH